MEVSPEGSSESLGSGLSEPRGRDQAQGVSPERSRVSLSSGVRPAEGSSVSLGS